MNTVVAGHDGKRLAFKDSQRWVRREKVAQRKLNWAAPGDHHDVDGKEDIARVATISGRDREIGDVIADPIAVSPTCSFAELAPFPLTPDG